MKRKEYQKPEMRIVVLTRCTCLLAGSPSGESCGDANAQDYGVASEQDI